jgi:hypothetical protein
VLVEKHQRNCPIGSAGPHRKKEPSLVDKGLARESSHGGRFSRKIPDSLSLSSSAKWRFITKSIDKILWLIDKSQADGPEIAKSLEKIGSSYGDVPHRINPCDDTPIPSIIAIYIYFEDLASLYT